MHRTAPPQSLKPQPSTAQQTRSPALERCRVWHHWRGSLWPIRAGEERNDHSSSTLQTPCSLAGWSRMQTLPRSASHREHLKWHKSECRLLFDQLLNQDSLPPLKATNTIMFNPCKMRKWCKMIKNGYRPRVSMQLPPTHRSSFSPFFLTSQQLWALLPV